MAERRAINKYYPPDWDPSQGSTNAYVGQHPLRDRARKLDEGILIVRFELPFSIWCGGCNGLLATGLRFNAEKKKAGSYYSTPIWSFRMKCRECSHWFEIRTYPKDSAYDVIDGARKKAEPEDLEDDNDELGEKIVDLSQVDESDKHSLLHELEVSEARKRRAIQAAERLSTLQAASSRDWKNPDRANAELRRIFRTGRKAREENQRQSDEIRSRTGIGIPILPPSAADSVRASSVQFGPEYNADERKKLAREVIGRPLFSKSSQSRDSGLKARLLQQHLGKTDPFASQQPGPAERLPDLGIRQRKLIEAEPENGLDLLSKTYADMSSSSSDD